MQSNEQAIRTFVAMSKGIDEISGCQHLRVDHGQRNDGYYMSHALGGSQRLRLDSVHLAGEGVVDEDFGQSCEDE